MAGQFETFGPYSLKTVDGAVARVNLEDMWKAADPNETGLCDAVGIYLVARKNSKDNLIPVYVGMTEAGFRKRFKQHVHGKKGFVKISDSKGESSLEVFFIALMTPSDHFRKPVKGSNKVLAIRHLETMLIGACLRLNKHLLNTSYKALYRALNVPGYLDSGVQDRSKAAAQLAALLAAKS
jgi:hypothetical protein